MNTDSGVLVSVSAPFAVLWDSKGESEKLVIVWLEANVSHPALILNILERLGSEDPVLKGKRSPFLFGHVAGWADQRVSFLR
jgi:hypothetical protein